MATWLGVVVPSSGASAQQGEPPSETICRNISLSSASDISEAQFRVPCYATKKYRQEGKEHPFPFHLLGDIPCFQAIDSFSSFISLWLFSYSRLSFSVLRRQVRSTERQFLLRLKGGYDINLGETYATPIRIKLRIVELEEYPQKEEKRDKRDVSLT